MRALLPHWLRVLGCRWGRHRWTGEGWFVNRYENKRARVRACVHCHVLEVLYYPAEGPYR